MFLGFNTGRLEKISLEEKMKTFLELGCNALEISFMDFADGEIFDRELGKFNLSNFKYLSLHTPVHNMFYKNDEKTKEVLCKVAEYHKKYNFKTIVVHPSLVEDFSIFTDYNLPVAFENMDQRQNSYRNVFDMQKIFFETNFNMVLDVNHCYVNDNTMKLAVDFYDNFKDRIKEIHLSGYETHHENLYKTKQIEIIKAIPDFNIPIIIESQQDSLEDIVNEYNYIISALKVD